MTFVSTASDISALLSCITDLPTSSPSLHIDLEGAKLSRDGTISLLTLYVLPTDTVYLIDIVKLGAAAFSTPTISTPATSPASVSETAVGKQASPTSPALTLKSILESPTIPKVLFDVRNDSDALFAHFDIALECVDDLQLMELATRVRKSRQYLAGLAWCIEHDSHMSHTARKHTESVKEQGIKLFAPENGGSYAVFDERPLQSIVLEYCVQDVVHMPKLWNTYRARMKAFWEVMVKEASRARIAESQSASYQWAGAHKKNGHWPQNAIKKAKKRWSKGNRTGLCGLQS